MQDCEALNGGERKMTRAGAARLPHPTRCRLEEVPTRSGAACGSEPRVRGRASIERTAGSRRAGGRPEERYRIPLGRRSGGFSRSPWRYGLEAPPGRYRSRMPDIHSSHPEPGMAGPRHDRCIDYMDVDATDISRSEAFCGMAFGWAPAPSGLSE